MTSSKVNRILGTALMTSTPMEKAFKAFKKATTASKQNYKMLGTIAAIGESSAKLWNQNTFETDCRILKNDTFWWDICSKFKVVVNESQFRNCKDLSYHRELITSLIDNGTPITTAIDFSKFYCMKGLNH